MQISEKNTDFQIEVYFTHNRYKSFKVINQFQISRFFAQILTMAPTLDLVVAKSDSFHILKSGSTWTNILMIIIKIQFNCLQKKSGQNVFLPELVCICTVAPHTVAAYTAEPGKRRLDFTQNNHRRPFISGSWDGFASTY